MSVEQQQPPIQIERRKNPADAPLPAFQLERRNIPRTTIQPPFVAGATDPDLTRPSRTISPGKLLSLLSVIAFVALACADPVQNFVGLLSRLVGRPVFCCPPNDRVLARQSAGCQGDGIAAPRADLCGPCNLQEN